MDIWRWVHEVGDELVENGRVRLAELIDEIPGHVVDHEHEKLDAAVPEAVALAREAKKPWVELFVRHWSLQSRILHRHEVASFLPEAVSLIEFASRDDTRDCPQSVCVTQDLTGCYSKIDGPGYASERLEVARETLGRIDARWPCFCCISAEYATALIDAGDAEGALVFLDRQAVELTRAGRALAARQLDAARIEALYEIGRFDEALDVAARGKERATSENDRGSHALDCAACLAHLGRFDEARTELSLVPFEKVWPTHSLYERWSHAVFALAKGGAIPNDWHLDGQLRSLLERLRENGVIRSSIELCHRRARLALLRERPGTAAECAAIVRDLLPKLRAPLGADEELEALEHDVAAAVDIARARSTRDPETAEEALAARTHDPELDLAALRAARARFPENEQLAVTEASVLLRIGNRAAADATLAEHLARDPDAAVCLMMLGRGLLERNRPAEARLLAETTLARGPREDMQARAHWLAATSYEAEGSHAKARPHLERLLDLSPARPEVELMLARLDRAEGKLEAALTRLDRLVTESDRTVDADWERIIVATLLDRWDSVRESARRVGMVLDGEGPINEPWSLCRVAFRETGGTTSIQYALRTGPVTARVLDVAAPHATQHFADDVVIDPSPQNPPPSPGAEKGHTYVYPIVAVRHAGGYRSFTFDGPDPGDPALHELRDRLDAIGCVLSVRSDEAYVLTPTDGEPIPGVSGYLAVPEGRALEDVRAELDRWAADCEATLVWPLLAQELGLVDVLLAQADVIERYGL